MFPFFFFTPLDGNVKVAKHYSQPNKPHERVDFMCNLRETTTHLAQLGGSFSDIVMGLLDVVLNSVHGLSLLLSTQLWIMQIKKYMQVHNASRKPKIQEGKNKG